MRLNFTFIFTLALTVNHLRAPLITEARPTPPAPAEQASAPPKQGELSPTLKALNGMMHSAIREAVSDERASLGPLIMFEDGKMKLFRDDVELIALPATPPLVYHQLKVIGHSLFVTVIQLWRPSLTPEQRVA